MDLTSLSKFFPTMALSMFKDHSIPCCDRYILRVLANKCSKRVGHSYFSDEVHVVFK